jgi:hypothetical protein
MAPTARRCHGFPRARRCITLTGMTRDIIVQILESEGAKGGANGFAFREDRDATCFVSAPGDLLQIPRVVKIDLKEKFVALQTAKDERFLFAYEDVLGFKLTPAATKDRTAGFGS